MPKDWMDRARCRERDPEQFFVRGAANSRRAIRICERCEVREDCLRYALVNEIDFGVWGGMTERQRRRFAREQPAAVAAG